jgi:DNA-binding transcriptional LysR family regulator
LGVPTFNPQTITPSPTTVEFFDIIVKYALPTLSYQNRYIEKDTSMAETPWSEDPADLISDGTAPLLRAGLKLGHLRLILALDEQEKVSAAASLLNITQPAASRMIAEIEAILQTPLCERLPRGVVLTPIGKVLARRARSVLLELREADREVADLRAGRGGSVFLGTVTAPAIDLAVPAIARARTLYPKMDINIQVDTSTVLVRELLASRQDFVIARVPDDLDPRLFRTKTLSAERACLVVRRDHPLLGRGIVPLNALAALDWVMQPNGTLLRRTVERVFMAHNVPLPTQVLSTTSLLLSLVLIAETDAITPIAYDMARFVNRSDKLGGRIDILPLSVDIWVEPYSLITVRGRGLSPAAEMLYRLVEEESARRVGAPPIALD